MKRSKEICSITRETSQEITEMMGLANKDVKTNKI